MSPPREFLLRDVEGFSWDFGVLRTNIFIPNLISVLIDFCHSSMKRACMASNYSYIQKAMYALSSDELVTRIKMTNQLVIMYTRVHTRVAYLLTLAAVDC